MKRSFDQISQDDTESMEYQETSLEKNENTDAWAQIYNLTITALREEYAQSYSSKKSVSGSPM